MLRICLFCRYFYPHVGGNETQAMNLALELINHGLEVMIVTTRVNDADKRFENYRGIKIYRVRYFSLLNLYSLFQQLIRKFRVIKSSDTSGQLKSDQLSTNKGHGLRKKIANLSVFIEEYSFMLSSLILLKRLRSNFDLIHSQMLFNYGYMAFSFGKILKKPVLIKDASLGGLEKVTLKPRIEKKKSKLRNFGNFIAVSSMIEDNFISQGIDKSRIYKIYNGIDISTIDQKNNDAASPKSILYVGNFWQGTIKGLDVLIDAMNLVVKKHPDVILTIAGKGDIQYYSLLAKEAGCLCNINFIGQTRDTDALYRSNSVFVLPSRQEGMSNAVLEAMSYGMACVVTDVSGAKDQIQSYKEGIIVPIEDTISLANALCFMLENKDEMKSMGMQAKQKIKEKFDMQITAEQTIDVYHKLINNNI